jgi:hypothetical protein
VRRKYYWCVHHKAWTLHSPQECRKSEENRRKRKSPSKHEGSSKKKRTYDKARIAFEALALFVQAIQPHLAATPTVLKTQTRTAISQELPPKTAAAQNHPHRATRLLSMTLMNPDC